MKINGLNPYRPLEQPKKTKKADQGKFEKVLDKNVKSPKQDSVTLGSSIDKAPSNYGYMPPVASKSAPAEGEVSKVDGVVRQVVESPEQANGRLEEIRKIIDEGGAEAYFRSVDSEKVAEKLLNSGLFDDIV